MKAQDWRICIYDSTGHWKGFTFADTEEEAREQVTAVRLPGDRAVVDHWKEGTREYRHAFTRTDTGEYS